MRRSHLLSLRSLFLLILCSLFAVSVVAPKRACAESSSITYEIDPPVECQPALMTAVQTGDLSVCGECHALPGQAPAGAPLASPMLAVAAPTLVRELPPADLSGYEKITAYYTPSQYVNPATGLPTPITCTPDFTKKFELAYRPTVNADEPYSHYISTAITATNPPEYMPMTAYNLVTYYYEDNFNDVPRSPIAEEWALFGQYANPTYTITHTHPAGTHTYGLIILHGSCNQRISFGWFITEMQWTVNVVDAAPVEPTIEIVGYHSIDIDGNDNFYSIEDYTMLTLNDPIVIEAVYPGGNTNPAVRDEVYVNVFSHDTSITEPPPSAIISGLQLAGSTLINPWYEPEIIVTLVESGPNTGIFYNYNPVAGFNPDYNYPVYLGGITAGNTVRVDNEDHLITAYLPPSLATSVFLDLAEYGIAYIQNYSGCYYNSLNTTLGNAKLIAEELSDLPLPPFREHWTWDKVYYNRVSNQTPDYPPERWEVTEAQYNSLTDNAPGGADTVDFAAWFGHGPAEEDYKPGSTVEYYRKPYLHFNYATPHGTWDKKKKKYIDDPEPREDTTLDLYRNEVKWGDLDLEYIALFTCSFLDDCVEAKDVVGGYEELAYDLSDFKTMGGGARMLLGFSNVMVQLEDNLMTKIFFDRMINQNMSIKNSWIEMAKVNIKVINGVEYDGDGVVVYDVDAEDDHLPGLSNIYSKKKDHQLNRYYSEGDDTVQEITYP